MVRVDLWDRSQFVTSLELLDVSSHRTESFRSIESTWLQRLFNAGDVGQRGRRTSQVGGSGSGGLLVCLGSWLGSWRWHWRGVLVAKRKPNTTFLKSERYAFSRKSWRSSSLCSSNENATSVMHSTA